MNDCGCYYDDTADGLRPQATDQVFLCPLHAAAPELLKACKAALRHEPDLRIAKQLRTAIAKAEGRTK